jgi:excisionase family DNA binding protein
MDALTVTEAARLLRVSERTVYRMLDSGSLEASRVGSQWRIRPASVAGIAGRRLAEPKPEVDVAVAAALEAVLQRVVGIGFRRYFCEDDILADLLNEVRSRLGEDAYEVHLELDTAGSPGRCYPDLSVIPALDSIEDRRGSAAVFSLEAKMFSYRGRGVAYRLDQPQFRELLELMASQFERLRERVRLGLLGAGALLWVDAFDWWQRTPENEREAMIVARADWVRSRFLAIGSRVRVDYLPMFYPQRRVVLFNGLPLTQQSIRPRGSLLGAAVPFIRRWPAPDEDWDEAIGKSTAEDWFARQEP